MPILMPTDIHGTVRYLGLVRDRTAALPSAPVSEVEATFAGFAGEDHGGLTRPSCSRVTSQYVRGTTIRNTRQISILSVEEMAQIAERMGLAALAPEWVGASLVLEGIPDLSAVPPSSRLIFESGASLTIDMENAPCHLPAKVIEGFHPEIGKRFKTAARDRRGVTAWVEAEGAICLGDRARLHVPKRRPWPHG